MQFHATGFGSNMLRVQRSFVLNWSTPSVWPWNHLISPIFWPSCSRGRCADPHWPSALSPEGHPVTTDLDLWTTGKDPAAKQRCDRAVRALGFWRAKLATLSPWNFGQPIFYSMSWSASFPIKQSIYTFKSLLAQPPAHRFHQWAVASPLWSNGLLGFTGLSWSE